MIAADIPSCEWHPGSNRSIVDPVVAIARLDMPAPTRAALIAKMERHQFDDVVTITWAAVLSKRLPAAGIGYSSEIRRMNFGNGRICEQVTRDKWTAEQKEEAIVYSVDGILVGFAAACGNVFLLSPGPGGPEPLAADPALLPISAPPADTQPLLPAGPIGNAPGALAAAPLPGPMAGEYGPGPAWGGGGAGGFGGGGGFGVVVVDVCTCCGTPLAPAAPVIPAVPEPGAWALIAAGLGCVVVVARGKT